MRTIIWLIAISATVLTLTGIMTTLAKSENMAYKLKIFHDDPNQTYENPWIKDKINGKCNGTEKFYKFVTATKDKFAQCMPHVNNSGQCPTPPLFDDGMDAIAIKFNNDTVCVAECSNTKGKCPTGGTCMAAPKDLQSANVKNICVYKSDYPPKHYEDPWTKDVNNGKCNADEKLDVFTTRTGDKFAQCMPQVNSSGSKCPAPPLSDDGMKAISIKSGNDKVCVAECSDLKGECPFGGTCMAASSDFKSSEVKNICVFIHYQTYENPWTKDKTNGKCNADEMLAVITTGAGDKFAQCMPRVNDSGQCPTPPLFDDDMNGISIKLGNDTVCVAECSDTKGKCPSGGKCMMAPYELQFPGVKNICVYDQPPQQPPKKLLLIEADIIDEN